MRIANIFRLGIKELRGLMRDPMLLILIVYAFTLAIYTAAKAMPEIIQTIMLAAPNTHFVILAQSILFRGAGLGVVWPQFLALFVIGSVLFLFALRRFRAFLR